MNRALIVVVSLFALNASAQARREEGPPAGVLTEFTIASEDSQTPLVKGDTVVELGKSARVELWDEKVGRSLSLTIIGVRVEGAALVLELQYEEKLGHGDSLTWRPTMLLPRGGQNQVKVAWGGRTRTLTIAAR